MFVCIYVHICDCLFAIILIFTLSCLCVMVCTFVHVPTRDKHPHLYFWTCVHVFLRSAVWVSISVFVLSIDRSFSVNSGLRCARGSSSYDVDTLHPHTWNICTVISVDEFPMDLIVQVSACGEATLLNSCVVIFHSMTTKPQSGTPVLRLKQIWLGPFCLHFLIFLSVCVWRFWSSTIWMFVRWIRKGQSLQTISNRQSHFGYGFIIKP